MSRTTIKNLGDWNFGVGTDSTRLWDAYVNNFGGEFWSVDLSPMPSKRLKKQVGCHTHLVVQDSISFLGAFRLDQPIESIDICHLDSWDLDWENPLPAALHGLDEWHAVLPLLSAGAFILIDDTPTDISWVPQSQKTRALRYHEQHGIFPGKGAPVLKEIEEGSLPVEIVWQGYSVALLYRG